MMQSIEYAVHAVISSYPAGSLVTISEAVALVRKVLPAVEQPDAEIAEVVASAAVQAGLCVEFDVLRQGDEISNPPEANHLYVLNAHPGIAHAGKISTQPPASAAAA